MNEFTSRLPSTMRRRTLLGLAAGGGLAAMTGCGSGDAGAGFGENERLRLPAHVEPKPVTGQVGGSVPGVPPGYTTLPDPLPKATKGAPGSGAPFTTFQINWGAPPRPRAKNAYWREFEKRLNIDYRPTLVPADAYDTKLATMLSGGKLTDMVFLHTDSANAQQAIKDGAFAELSDVLGGDKIKEYPNLAAVPPHQWKASAINNGIYGIPSDLAYVNAIHVYRADWARKLGLPEPPKNADEFAELAMAMSKRNPAGGRQTYAFGGFPGGLLAFVNAMFRVPNNWREKGGSFTHMIETDEYEQSLRYAVRLWKGGAFHPDALSLSEQGAKDRELFYGGTTGWQVASGDNWYLAGTLEQLRQKDEDADPQPLLPFGHDGGSYAFPASPGFYAVVAISAEAASDEKRLREILRIYDYLRAPAASAEGFFLRYGVEGVHFDYDDHHNPVSTSDTATANDRDAMFYTGLAPAAFHYPNAQEVRETVTYTEAITKSSVKDPSVGLFSPSAAKVSTKLDELVDDYVGGIVSGRRPFSDLKRFREDWRSQGGDTWRRELEKARQVRR